MHCLWGGAAIACIAALMKQTAGLPRERHVVWWWLQAAEGAAAADRAARERAEASAAQLKEEGERRARTFQGAVRAGLARAQEGLDGQLKGVQARCARPAEQPPQMTLGPQQRCLDFRQQLLEGWPWPHCGHDHIGPFLKCNAALPECLHAWPRSASTEFGPFYTSCGSAWSDTECSGDARHAGQLCMPHSVVSFRWGDLALPAGWRIASRSWLPRSRGLLPPSRRRKLRRGRQSRQQPRPTQRASAQTRWRWRRRRPALARRLPMPPLRRRPTAADSCSSA